MIRFLLQEIFSENVIHNKGNLLFLQSVYKMNIVERKR